MHAPGAVCGAPSTPLAELSALGYHCLLACCMHPSPSHARQLSLTPSRCPFFCAPCFLLLPVLSGSSMPPVPASTQSTSSWRQRWRVAASRSLTHGQHRCVRVCVCASCSSSSTRSSSLQAGWAQGAATCTCLYLYTRMDINSLQNRQPCISSVNKGTSTWTPSGNLSARIVCVPVSSGLSGGLTPFLLLLPPVVRLSHPQPQDSYGLEKLATEELCMHYNRDFGIECRIARFHNIYGPYGTWKGGREKAPAAFCRKVRVWTVGA